jgi:hypothetical protein
MVKFIFYATRPGLFGQEIAHIKSLLLTYNTKSVIITDRTQLVCLAPQLSKENNVVLLFASSDEELEDLVNLKEYFSSIPTILVLPDDNIETLQRGMLLHPLYFMAKHAELCQYSFAVNELCYIYEDRLNQSDRYSFQHNRAV